MSDTQTLESIKAAAPKGSTHYHIGLQSYLRNDGEEYHPAIAWQVWNIMTASWRSARPDLTPNKIYSAIGHGEIIALAKINIDDMTESMPFELLEGDNDDVKHPTHYQIGAGIQAIDIIKGAMTPEQYKGYLLGNQIKYRMRAGSKGDAAKCIAKADWYRDRLNMEFPA